MEVHMNESDRKIRTRLVWDLPVRIIHWSLVVAVLGAWFTQDVATDGFTFHVWFGYAVLALVVTRIVWGIVGTRHARFGSFVRGPVVAARYTASLVRGRDTPHVGHNPLGAWMVVLMLAMLFAQAATGLFANDQIMDVGPLFGYVDAATSDRMTTAHKWLFDVLVIAIGVHVLAVAFHLVVKRHDLLVPMFSGRKSAAEVPPQESIPTSRVWLAALILAGVATTIAIVVRNAPEASLSFF